MSLRDVAADGCPVCLVDTHFLKKSELEALITSGGFDIVETKDLSRLPDRFVVAKKTQ